MADIKKLQVELNQLDYPPTHTYSLNSLEPNGVLKERMQIIKSVAPHFFKGERFLDMGCNKGYFSLLAAQCTKEVVSIDIDDRFVQFCQKIKPVNMRVYKTGFRNFVAENEFDRIFIGNTHHYIFKEANGWDWIYKLAALSCGEVIIEGPIDMRCQDMANVIPKELQQEFTFEKFMGVMGKFFVLKKKVPAVSYTPDRYVMHFQRKPDLFQTKLILIEEIPDGKLLKEDENSRIVLVKLPQFNEPVIAKIVKNIPTHLKMSIAIGRFSPVSNGAIGSIYKGDKFVGWIESYTLGGVYAYRENERALFLRICDHEIFLSRLGYFDTDCATINFFRETDKLFDKGLMMPVGNISEEVYESFKGRSQGYFFIHLNNSFASITQAFQEKIYNALKSRDSQKIENTFLQIKNALRDVSTPSRSSFLKLFLFRLARKLGSAMPALLTKFEDFYPLSETEAFITVGINYNYLTHIRRVKYQLEGERVKIYFWSGKTVVRGSYLRLGNYFNNKLVYSDGQNIFKKSISEETILTEQGVQPYRFEGGLLYQHNGSIYLNEQEIIRPWADFSVVGRPSFAGGWVYFETRNGPAPWHWEVWRYNLKTKEKCPILSHGANPYVYSGKLFYSKWEENRFNTYYINESIS